MIEKVKTLCPGHLLLVILMMKKFYEKKIQKTNLEFRVENVINRRGDKPYIKWKGFDNYFKRLVDKSGISI